MSGKEILVDTNIILHLLKGSNVLSKTLQGKNLQISFITELELLGFPGISKSHEEEILLILDYCAIIPMNNRIRDKYIDITRKYQFKLPDAVIAASAITLDIPLITEDKGFKKISELNLIFYDRTATSTNPGNDRA